MAKESILRCDSPDCGSTEGVATVTIAVGKKAFEVDLCAEDQSYYLSTLESVGRRPTRTTVRPRHKFAMTPIDPRVL